MEVRVARDPKRALMLRVAAGAARKDRERFPKFPAHLADQRPTDTIPPPADGLERTCARRLPPRGRGAGGCIPDSIRNARNFPRFTKQTQQNAP